MATFAPRIHWRVMLACLLVLALVACQCETPLAPSPVAAAVAPVQAPAPPPTPAEPTPADPVPSAPAPASPTPDPLPAPTDPEPAPSPTPVPEPVPPRPEPPPPPAPPPPTSYALAFDGSPMTVDSGPFWPADTPLGPFYWVARVRPAANAHGGYILSDGYGGAHALLVGFLAGSGALTVTGNVWDGVQRTSFHGGTCQQDVWCEVAVRWDGARVTIEVDGQTTAMVPFVGPRISPGPSGGGGHVFVGGSDHLNFAGQIAWIRGWEDRADPSGPPSLAYDFRTPSDPIRDDSAGYRGRQHDGARRGVARGALVECASCPAPVFVPAGR